MEILVIGSDTGLLECRQKFGDRHQYQLAESRAVAREHLKPGVIVFDFIEGEHHRNSVYQDFSGVVFLDVSRSAPREMAGGSMAIFIGFCGLPTFVNREILEVSLFRGSDKEKLIEAGNALNTKLAVVNHQVGLVTARVIGAIINEAYFAVQANIASRSDIDLAMKLGTNYPYGPFEWCEKIGVNNVFDLLSAVYKSTGDDRYQVSALLAEEAGISSRGSVAP